MKQKAIFELYSIFDVLPDRYIWSRKDKKDIPLNENERILCLKKSNKVSICFWFVYILGIIFQIFNIFINQNIISLLCLFFIMKTSRAVPSTFYKFKREVNVGDYYLEDRYDYKKIRNRTKKETIVSILKHFFFGIEDDRKEPRLYRIKSIHLQPQSMNPDYDKLGVPLVIYIAKIIE